MYIHFNVISFDSCISTQLLHLNSNWIFMSNFWLVWTYMKSFSLSSPMHCTERHFYTSHGSNLSGTAA